MGVGSSKDIFKCQSKFGMVKDWWQPCKLKVNTLRISSVIVDIGLFLKCFTLRLKLEGQSHTILSHQCGLTFGVTCCYKVLLRLSFFCQLSYIIFYNVHTNHL